MSATRVNCCTYFILFCYYIFCMGDLQREWRIGGKSKAIGIINQIKTTAVAAQICVSPDLELQAIMAENIEIEDRLDLEYDSYSEDDYVEDSMVHEEAEEGVEETSGEEIYKSNSSNKSVEYEETHDTSIKEVEKEKHTQLLARPPHGSEVFIGGLSQGTSEEDLRKLCKHFGEIFEMRIMKNSISGERRGFAFVEFKTEDVAQKAIEELHGKDFKGRTLRCSLSDAKYTLFISNIPKNWSDDDFKRVIEDIGPGVENIELIKDPLNPGHNRGFSFVEYYNTACADYARLKMLSADFKLNSNTLTVTWAQPKPNIAHRSSVAAQVKTLYVKYIPDNTPTEKLKELFQRHGEVTKVVVGKRDFAFVSYALRSSALRAIRDTETYEINGQVLEISLAKPQTAKKFPHNPTPTSNYNPDLGSGTANEEFHQSMIYGRGATATPEWMQMVPIVLPDGRIGYVIRGAGTGFMSRYRPY